MAGGGVGGAGAARREAEWLRAYGRAAAVVPRVEALAAGLARLDAVNALQHESWEARDDRLQWRLLKADENMRMWEATCMAQQPSGDGRLFAELLKSENEDLEDFIQVLELENEELKIRVKEVEGGAGHCQNAAGHEHIAGDLEAALRQLNQVHEALIAEKDKEIPAVIAEKDKEISALIAEKDKGFSALIAEKDLVREQFMTLERDYADLHSYSSKQEAQVTEAKQELEQLQVAFQKKDDEICLHCFFRRAQAKRRKTTGSGSGTAVDAPARGPSSEPAPTAPTTVVTTSSAPPAEPRLRDNLSADELHAGFLSRLNAHRGEELKLVNQLKKRYEETTAGLKDAAAASQTAKEVAEGKLRAAVTKLAELETELSTVRKAAETREAELTKRAEDAESRLKTATDELAGLHKHVNLMTEAIFGKKSRQLSSDSILKLKAVYTLTEQLYCGAVCTIKAMLGKKSISGSLKDVLDLLSTLPQHFCELKKSAARRGAIAGLSRALAYTPGLTAEEMMGGFPSLKDDGSEFTDADYTRCLKASRVLASALVEETDLSTYKAAYSSADQRIRPPTYTLKELTPKGSKQPFDSELDPSSFFEGAQFESLLNCNWDADNLQIQDPAQDDPAKQ